MIPEIANHIEQINEICRLLQVQSLYLVGSAAREHDFAPDSDIDLMYSMIKDDQGLPASGCDSIDLLWKLEETLGRKIDLIPDNGLRNKYFLRSLTADKIKLYEA
jgi:hypothetical protein